MRTIISQQLTVTKDNFTSWIYSINETGLIIYRDKIDTLTGVPHPGIILGADNWGTTWVIHNHYKNGRVIIESLQDFAEGSQCFYDSRPVFYSKEDVIQRAIERFIEKKEYHWLTHNCQHFVNNVAQGMHYSETVDKLSDKAMIAGGLATLLGVISENKNLTQVGIGILAVGGAGKGISRYTTKMPV
jgi:hypothetical protein